MSASRDYVQEMFRAIEVGDMDTFKQCFTPDGVVWHNHDGLEQNIEDTSQSLAWLHGAMTDGLKYVDQTIARSGSQVFVKHVLKGHLASGKDFNLAAMMWIELNDSGLVTRLDEYFDSRALDVLAG